jgi:hypothetical protein
MLGVPKVHPVGGFGRAGSVSVYWVPVGNGPTTAEAHAANCTVTASAVPHW